eukprot:7481-Heterococcus_DN1.PRE.3
MPMQSVLLICGALLPVAGHIASIGTIDIKQIEERYKVTVLPLQMLFTNLNMQQHAPSQSGNKPSMSSTRATEYSA